jgi:nitronate monooxygenase/enoyl-[acyl-carrier protein] reductase II
MIRTALCDLFGISVPILLAPFGPWDEIELAAAVCDSGALGSLGTALRSPDELREQWARLRSRTERPFAVNHTGRPFDEQAFAATLEAQPAAISFHMGVPAELIARAHDRGIRWIQTVGDRRAAELAVEAGADVLVAQGGEAGGNSGWISTMVLVPLVVDIAGDVPVIAAGGIGDGRGIAAALVLGAQGASLGTRFLATTEMRIRDAWKRRIVAADASDAVKIPHSERVMPPFTIPQVGPAFAPRALRTPLIEQLESQPDTVDPAVAGPAAVAAIKAGGGEEFLPFAGQSVGLIRDVVPARELVHGLLAQAEAALQRGARLVRA